ncbi:MAG: hypothetical protein EA402_00930 [Planctomycetota bacterium]|nr:MAG: hypothetical protein EA402_00930 [Planctomycetota bacterium]
MTTPVNAGELAAAQMANAVMATGGIVHVEPKEFVTILGRVSDPLVISAQGGFFSTKYQYLTSYKGLVFYTQDQTPLNLPEGVEEVQAKKIWVPG